MWPFSKIKQMFVSECACVPKKMYSEGDFHAVVNYWKEKVKQAKEEGRREALAQCQPTVNKRPKRPNGSGCIIDHKRQRRLSLAYNKSGRRKKYIPTKEQQISYQDHKRKHKAMVQFVYDSCIWEENKIDASDLHKIYKWWCVKRGLPYFVGKVSIGKLIRSTGVILKQTKVNYKYNLYYEGIKIRPEVLEQYRKENL